VVGLSIQSFPFFTVSYSYTIAFYTSELPVRITVELVRNTSRRRGGGGSRTGEATQSLAP